MPITVTDPGGILEQLATVPPLQAAATYQEAETASATALENQAEEAQAELPEIPAPTGLPARETVGEEEGTEPTGAVETPEPEMESETGREEEPYDTKVEEAPPSPPQPVTRLPSAGPAEDEEAAAELAAQAQGALDSLFFDASEIETTAGEPPAVDTTGEADPGQMDSFEQESGGSVNAAKLEATAKTTQDFGENDIFPAPDDEILKAEVTLAAMAPQGAGGGGALVLPPEAAGLNDSLGPVLAERIQAEKQKYDAGEVQYDEDRKKAREDADQEISTREDEARTTQEGEQVKAKTEVAGARQEWNSELDKVEKDYHDKADKAGQEHRTKVQDKKKKGDDEAARHLEEAEQKAADAKKDAEKKASRKKKEAEEESDGFWGWVASAASALIDGLKAAVNFIYDNLRKAVKFIFETAKELALAAIELARMAVVGLIQAFGVVLKGLVSIAFSAFPEIEKKINAKIDKAVNAAVEGVNKAADLLKKGVAAVLDFLASTIDSLLGLIQSIYNGIFTVLGMIIRGEFKELMARIGSLVEAAKQSPSHIEGSVWEQLLGVDLTKPLPGEESHSMPAGLSAEPFPEGNLETGESGAGPAPGIEEIMVEPITSEMGDPELIEDLALEDGQEAVLAERGGEEFTIAGIARDFEGTHEAPGRAAPILTETARETQEKPQEPAGRSERAAKLWDQLKRFMADWLSQNWGKLLVAVVAALVGVIALTIVTGGAILAALPIIGKIVTALFVGVAIVKAMEHLRTYLAEGWEHRLETSAKGLANAVAVGIVELAMVLGFRALGGAAKVVGKVVTAGGKAAVSGVKAAASAGASALKRLLSSGATMVSRSGSAIIQRGKLILKGVAGGVSRGVKKGKDLVRKIFDRFRVRRIIVTRKADIIYVFGEINPRFLITTIKGIKFEVKKRGSAKAGKKKLEREFPSAKVEKIRADAPQPPKGNPKLGNDPSHPEFGTHTVSKHGPGQARTKNLKKLAQEEGVPQGQFRSEDDILKAERLTANKAGTHVVEVPGDVVLPSGEIVSTPYTVVVRLADGTVKTAYPARAKEIAHFVGRNIY